MATELGALTRITGIQEYVGCATARANNSTSTRRTKAMTADANVRPWTKGPWEVKTLEPQTLGHEWVDSSDVQIIADCSQANRVKNGFPCHMEDGETKANARLIAAAPEMYEALIQARGALYLDHMVDEQGQPYGTTVIALEAIEAVLAKAVN